MIRLGLLGGTKIFLRIVVNIEYFNVQCALCSRIDHVCLPACL